MLVSRFPILTVLILCAAGAAAGAEERRLGAHEHGRGTLEIALEGRRLLMELEAPGMDIVGFEHEAKTAGQKAAVEKGKKALGEALSLFKLPQAAKCKLAKATVVLESEAAGNEHGKADHDAKGEHGEGEHGEGEGDHKEAGGHAAFHATYELECEEPSRLTSIGFDYFKTFASAQELDVTIVTPKTQSAFKVSRQKPELTLPVLM